MKVVLYQQNIVWADPAANRRRLSESFAALAGADLVVLPEMFSTGFATKPEGIAEDEPCASLEWMKEESAKYGFALAGSVAVREDGKYYNRFFFVSPDGSAAKYDKHHLFTFGGEHKTFTAGDERVVVAYKGVRFLLEVCYDLRFPVWARSRKDYDAIIYVASWPEVRRNAWDALLRARAIENQCYVLAVNRTGDDPSLHYNGGTAMIDPFGNDLARAEDNKEQYVSAELDMEALERFRGAFPVLDDAEKFELK